MGLGEIGTYACLAGIIIKRRHRFYLVITGFLLLCLYTTVSARILFSEEGFFDFKSTVHRYSDILSSGVSVISANVVFLTNLVNSSSISRVLDRRSDNLGLYWKIHAGANGVNIVIVLATKLVYKTPRTLEYVFFQCYESWAFSLEALIFYGVANYWTSQYFRLSEEALGGNPLDVVGAHISLTKGATASVKLLEVQLLLVSSSSFIRLVVLAFYGAAAIKMTAGGLAAIAQYARQGLLCAAVLIIIARAGERLHAEASTTARNLHLSAWNKNGKYIRQVIFASLQLRSQPLRLKLWGLMPLDNTLLFTVTSAACTYVVVLLQFTSSPLLRDPTHNYTTEFNNSMFDY